jgi:predicted transcriptional regulator of viral defense system
VRLLDMTSAQERKVLSRLSRRGLAARVRRGFYLLPPCLPLGGGWSPSEALALTTLMRDRDAQFQICGPNAFHRYGWDEQVPNRVHVYNNRLSGDRVIGMVELTLVRIRDERLGSIESVKTPDGSELSYSSRARSLVDAVHDWSRFNSLPRAFGWIRDDLRNSRITTADLIDAVVRFGNQGTIRRIGYLLEELSLEQRIPVKLIERLERPLRATSSTIPWIPTLPKRGKVSKRWGLVANGAIPEST